MIPRLHLIQPPQLRPNLRRQLRRRLVRPRIRRSLLPTRLYRRLALPSILICSTLGFPRRTLRLRSTRSRRTLVIAEGEFRFEFLRIRAADGGCGVSSGARRSSAGALGKAGGVGAGEGVLGGFLAGLFLCDSRVDRVTEALYFTMWSDGVFMRVIWPGK